MEIKYILAFAMTLIPSIVKADVTFCGQNQTPWQIFYKVSAPFYCFGEGSGWQPVNPNQTQNFYTASGACKNDDWSYKSL